MLHSLLRTGGNFANGAVTGAMSYAFNQMKHQSSENSVLPGEHNYEHISDSGCAVDTSGCTRQNLVNKMHRTGAYPGQKSSLDPSGGYQYRKLDSIYGDPFTSDPIYSLPTSSGIVNVTAPNHALHPGFIIRDVINVDGNYRIRTTGGGWGKFGGLNNSRASYLWETVNLKVFETVQ